MRCYIFEFHSGFCHSAYYSLITFSLLYYYYCHCVVYCTVYTVEVHVPTFLHIIYKQHNVIQLKYHIIQKYCKYCFSSFFCIFSFMYTFDSAMIFISVKFNGIYVFFYLFNKYTIIYTKGKQNPDRKVIYFFSIDNLFIKEARHRLECMLVHIYVVYKMHSIDIYKIHNFYKCNFANWDC